MDEELQKILSKQGITIQYGFDNQPQYYKKGKLLTGKKAGEAGLLHTKTANELRGKQTASGVDDFLSHPLTNYFVPPTAVYTAGSKVVKNGFNPGSVALDILGAVPALKGAGTVGTGFLKTAKVASLLDDVSQLKDKKKKLAYGGTAMDVESPMEALFQMIRDSEESFFEAQNDPTVAGLKMAGKAMKNTGMSMVSSGLNQSENLNGFGKMAKKNMGNITNGVNMMDSFFGAFGGTVPSEIEGDEMVEFPNGEVAEAKGPSHEQGGIDMMLPEGSEVFSKRIKIDGVSIADRKKKREKKEFTIEELLKSNPSDILTQNSLKRTKLNHEKEEATDNNIQKVVGSILTPPTENKFAYGSPGPVYNNPDWMSSILSMMGGEPELNGDINEVVITPDLKPKNIKSAGIMGTDTPSISTGSLINGVPEIESKEGFDWSSIGDNLNIGDLGNALTMAGTAYSTFAPMQNTLKNRAGDTPNINAYKNFGEDAINRLDDATGYIDDMKNEALGDLELSRAGTINRNNNSARGINTLRALNLATDSSINEGKNDVQNSFTNQMMQLIGQQSQLENVQDQFVMKGEESRDLADRMDRDNFFSQMAEDIATKGTGIQQMGKNLNQTKQNEVAMNLINQLSQYGITVDKNGKLSYTKQAKADSAPVQQQKGYVDNGVYTDSKGNTITKEDIEKAMANLLSYKKGKK